MQDFHFQEDGIDVLIPISPTKHNEKPWALYKKCFQTELFEE